jgi:alkanesulfonate monooxygenase SsuD/methylene tetrahydromethanopterin reductase-like flavin-dependent oxidoreductase (luciferase family)
VRDIWNRHSLIHEKPGQIEKTFNGTLRSLVESMAIAGTPSHCTERLQEFLDAGLKTPIFYEVPGPDRGSSLRLIADEIIPSFS